MLVLHFVASSNQPSIALGCLAHFQHLDLENGLRKAKGETPLASLDDLDSEAETDEEDEDASKDALLRETGAILLDYIGMSQQLAMIDWLVR